MILAMAILFISFIVLILTTYKSFKSKSEKDNGVGMKVGYVRAMFALSLLISLIAMFVIKIFHG
jgi:hypothetical protein